MYQNQGAVKMEADTKPQSALNVVNERFSRQNANTNDLLNSIEERLHSILNKRHPQNEPGKAGVLPVTDMLTQLDMNLNIQGNSNDRLSQLLSHLSEII